jgi:quercetin dioxygenase-like cupin family protein
VGLSRPSLDLQAPGGSSSDTLTNHALELRALGKEIVMTTDEQLHRAASMAGLIDYQSGTVASRTIVKGKTGTVTVFAFDQGEELSEHTAPFDALVHVIDGQAEITIDGQPHALEAGEMIVMPADRPHAVRAVQKFKMVLVMIRS